MTDLDPVIHSQGRLRIMTTLAALAEGDRLTFPRLQQLLGTTAGNLSTHLRRLEDAGYVEVVKGHQGRVPSTHVSATRAGRRAFEDYLAALQELLDPTERRDSSADDHDPPGGEMTTHQSADLPILVEGVTRRFGETVALDDVSLTVRPGELVGLLGPNGAGKTTLLSLVEGLRRADSGTVRVFGRDPRDPAGRVRLGSTPQETGLPPNLRVAEVVDFIGSHYPDPVPTRELLGTFGLTELARRQTGGLSGGQKRRLAVALAVVGRPDLVLLDEPTTGLDVDARHILWGALRDLHAAGATVVVTSHYLEEIEALAERVVVVDRGHVLADAPLTEILGRVALRRVTLGLATSDVPRLAVLDGVVQHDVDPGGRHVLLTPDADAVVRGLVGSGVPFHDLEVRTATLEEAFLALTRQEAA